VISEVALRRARLVYGWVTVFGRVNHLGAKPATQVYSAWPSLVSRQYEYQRNQGVYRHTTSRNVLARMRGIAVLAGVWLRTS